MKLQFKPTGDTVRDADAVAYLIMTSTKCGKYQEVYDLLTELDSQRIGGSKETTARNVLLALPAWYESKNQTLWLSTCRDLVLAWLDYRKGTK